MAGDSTVSARTHLAAAGVAALPDDWDAVELGNLLAEERGISVGVMYPGDHFPDGVPLIKAGDLNGSIINPHPEFRISREKHHEYRRTELEGGELVMTLVGNVGQCAVVPPRMAGWNTARAVAVIRLSDPSEAQFVQQCLLSRPLQHLMDVWCNTTVQATLNLKEIRQLPLPWPPKHCRDTIAAFGKALDDKIELNRRMNATLEAMARALFQSWFVDFDPVMAKMDRRKPDGLEAATAALFPASFQDSPIGRIPKGWEVERFDAHITAERGLSYKGEGLRDDCTGVPMHNLNSVYEGGGYKHEGIKYYAGEYREKHLLKPGDMIVTNTEQGFDHLLIGHAAIVPECYGPKGIYSHHIFRVRHKPSSAFSPHYLVELFNNRRWHYWISGFSNGTTINMLPMDALEIPLLVVPPIELVKKFTVLAEAAHLQVENNKEQSRNLATMRDTLLPKLLSGEIRVVEALREVEAKA
ncbi:MAG: restriction endonuclease subunit S [Pseudomonadota bacterium]